MEKFTQVGNQEIAVIEELYQEYLSNPESVDESWRLFFKGFELARRNFKSPSSEQDTTLIDKEFAILNLIHGYRQRGHLFTKTNPVRARRKYLPTLAIENFGLEQADLERTFQAGNSIGIGPAKLADIVAYLEATYCESVGVEYVYMRQPEVVQWLQQRMESSRNSQSFTDEKRKHIFYHLKLAVGFENFIHKKFVGQKRFSLEGAETLIPAMDAVIERGSELGIEEFIIGMAHRGRLNVLANILQKPYKNIFKEFYGTEYEEEISLGDVKYHLGYEGEVTADSGKPIKLKLMPNPSHLETVSPIVQGMVRSRIDSAYGGDFCKVAPIVIHGDAAIATQGVVYEVIQMSQLDGYKTGGTIHLVINNQVGFTTNYLDARSSTYCTDVAKVTRSPVFHVNGDDVEALIYTIKLAMDFRQEFHSDVFVDILCYRKYGHNEGDEPRFTQPLLYEAIEKHKNPRDIYAEKLDELGILNREESRRDVHEFEQFLEEKYKESEQIEKLNIRNFLVEECHNFEVTRHADLFVKTDTGVPVVRLKAIAEKLYTLPTHQTFYKKLNRILEDRRTMILDDRLDWAMAELLAYGTLLTEGHPVRVSGQDSERGTFAHRHAPYVYEDGSGKYYPLKHIADNQAEFNIFNSPLSEYGVMGFEYGYALAQPNALTVWEAQFGDFHNVAQVIIDQYIASASEKWGLMNNLVLYLPHGYEGQGPEHSSGRIERFLALAASNNMQVVVPTTPANMYHLIRRHLKWNYRLPLIVFTPKSLLRHSQVLSSVEELANGHFQEVIDDLTTNPEQITKLVFTSGRLYYDLVKQKTETASFNIAIVRVEQLFPLPEKKIMEIVQKYSKTETIIWAQDEPENMGAWPFVSKKLSKLKITPVARPESASPAGGLLTQHNKRLKSILDRIFADKSLVKIK